MQWLGENRIPFAIVFTKADKLKPKALEQQVKAYLSHLLSDAWEETPRHFITSASTGQGKDELLSYIDEINKAFYNQP